MYLDHFQLKELPFRLSPDPAFLYLSKNHARAKAYMESTIWFTDGFVVVTGEIGSGKTTLIETFLKELERDVVVAQINQTQVSPIEFLQSILVQFGFSPFKMKKAEILATLNQFMVEQYAAGRKILLIVDEAQNLSLRVLEEIRLLSGVETTKEKVLRIILAGQPELNEKLDAPELVQLMQRVRLRFHLSALSAEDTRGYVLHRLEVAGSQGRELFDEDCHPLIYRYTGGVPRLINTLCDTALLVAFGQDLRTVTPAVLRAAIDELRWVEFAARAPRPTAAPAAPAAPASIRLLDRGAAVGRLVVAHEGRPLTEIELRPGRFLIGRTTENDLALDAKVVSRHHCQVICGGDVCVLEDLNSTNGVYIKSKRIRRHHLNDGDVFIVGHYEIMYLDERSSRRDSDTGEHVATEVLPPETTV
jgi:general secretion pathway protein A